MAKDPKGIDLLLLAGGKPKEAPPKDDYREMLLHAADVLLDAVKAGDRDAVADALQSACEACEGMPHAEGPSEETGEME